MCSPLVTANVGSTATPQSATPQSASLTASSVRHSQSASFASSLAALLASLDSSAAIAATGCAASFVPPTQGSLLDSGTTVGSSTGQKPPFGPKGRWRGAAAPEGLTKGGARRPPPYTPPGTIDARKDFAFPLVFLIVCTTARCCKIFWRTYLAFDSLACKPARILV